MSAERRAQEMEVVGTAFMGLYEGVSPSHVVRAPGRVNLMGDHTDYNGLPVLPMALEQEVRIFFRARSDNRVRVSNFNEEFPPRDFHLEPRIPAGEAGDWGNYLKAAGQALTRRFSLDLGVDALVQSTLPLASGLSSSSALVNAMGLALLQANGISLSALEMAEEMARAERYTGTRGGGMDQAISLGARAGHASRIEFDPLRMFPTRLPRTWHFLVAHSMVRAEKSGDAKVAYNRRRSECDEALAIMGTRLPLASGEPATYRELVQATSARELIQAAEGHLPPTLQMRFRHVITEAQRVYAAETAMAKGDLRAFGILMDRSHESLKEDFEVSCPELDRLVELARKGGAAGARLTGAGFGGCVVALADSAVTDTVMGTLREGYYRRRGVEGPLDGVLFVARASAGADIRPL